MVQIIPRKQRPVPERPVIIQSGEHCLEGLFINKENDHWPALLNSPHPHFGGNMDSSLLNELAYALSKENISSLRYNYRGVGGSQGESQGGEAEVQDMVSAMDFLLDSTHGDKNGAMVSAGFSFGSWIAYKVAQQDQRIRRTLLVAPPIQSFDFSDLPKIKTSLALLVGERDQYCPVNELQKLLAHLKTKNSFWKEPLLFVVPEASHYFVRGLSQAGRVGATYLRTGKLIDPLEEKTEEIKK